MERRAPRPRRTFVRRSPEAARTELLDAAERVFARFSPDEVGLREIAAEAKVSHGLVTHYFGTYVALVDATLKRRLEVARSAMLERLVGGSFGPDNLPLLDGLAELIHDPLTLRLLTWSLLSGHAKTPAFFGDRGLKLVVDGIGVRLASLGLPVPPRARLEFSVMAAISLAFGLAIVGDAMHAALGHDASFDRDAAFAEIKVMVRRYVDRRGP